MHAFDRRAPERGVFSAPPFKVFFKKNLYSAVDSKGVRDTSLETGFRPMEHQASILINSILETVRKQRLPGLTADMRSFLDLFVYYQWKRVPDTVDRTVSRADLDALAAESIAEFERDVRPLTDEERKQFADPATWERMIKNSRRDVIASGSPEVVDAFSKMTVNFVHVRNPKKAFIIGSAPVVKLNLPGQPHINAPATQIWLPIASDVAIAYSGQKPGRYVPVTDAQEIKQVNLSIAWGSNLIASRAAALTASLAGEAGARMHLVGL